MKNVAIIGIGNCGSQIAWLAEKRYPDLFDSIYINTSNTDLSMVSNSDTAIKFKIGKKSEVDGSGKDRLTMKENLKKDFEKIISEKKFTDLLQEKKYAFICVSTAGGTGSGGGPVLLEILRQLFPDVNFILVAVLPRYNASLLEQENTLEFLDELYEKLGENTTYMIYDNETTVDLPDTVSLTAVNEAVVEDLRILTGVDNYATPYESIDGADMESIITTPGRLLVTRITKQLTEKFMEDNDVGDIIIKAIKKSCHTETDRNKKVIRWGIITYFTEQVNALYSSSLNKLMDFIGTPLERFNHNAINDKNENLNFMYFIASGLSPINDRVTRITEKVEELRNAEISDKSTKYVRSGIDDGFNLNDERRKISNNNEKLEDVNPMAAFDKFM